MALTVANVQPRFYCCNCYYSYAAVMYNIWYKYKSNFSTVNFDVSCVRSRVRVWRAEPSLCLYAVGRPANLSCHHLVSQQTEIQINFCSCCYCYCCKCTFLRDKLSTKSTKYPLIKFSSITHTQGSSNVHMQKQTHTHKCICV